MRVDNNGLEINFLTPDDTKGHRFTMRRLTNLIGKTVTGVGLVEFNPIVGDNNDVFYTLLLTDNETGQEQLVTFLRDEEANGPGYFDIEYLGYKTSRIIRQTTNMWKDELGPDPFEFGDILESDVE